MALKSFIISKLDHQMSKSWKRIVAHELQTTSRFDLLKNWVPDCSAQDRISACVRNLDLRVQSVLIKRALGLKISGCKRWCPKDLRVCAPCWTCANAFPAVYNRKSKVSMILEKKVFWNNRYLFSVHIQTFTSKIIDFQNHFGSNNKWLVNVYN